MRIIKGSSIHSPFTEGSPEVKKGKGLWLQSEGRKNLSLFGKGGGFVKECKGDQNV